MGNLSVSDKHLAYTIIEPRHDKTNKMSVRPMKTQISLGIHPVWSESSLCAQWVGKDPRFLHADSEDWLVWAEFVGFVKSWLIYGAVLTQQLPESKFFSVKASHTRGSCYWVSLSYRLQSHVFRKSRRSTPRTKHLGSPPELSGRQTVHLGNPVHTVGYLDLKEIINGG